MGNHDADPTVLTGFGREGVQVDVEVAVVERLEPTVGQLEVPVVALRGRRLDDESLVGLDFPVAVVVGDVGITSGREGAIGVKAAATRSYVRLEVLEPTRQRSSRSP